MMHVIGKKIIKLFVIEKNCSFIFPWISQENRLGITENAKYVEAGEWSEKYIHTNTINTVCRKLDEEENSLFVLASLSEKYKISSLRDEILTSWTK